MNYPLHEVAWVGERYVEGAIRGVMLSFHGLGGGEMRSEPWGGERVLAAHGVLPVFPYYGPWSWMNREARTMVDCLVAQVYREYALAPTTPLLLCGGSMGGGSALLYARYAAAPIAACSVNCPVCDFPYHFTERPDVARTMYHAFGAYDGQMSTVLKEHSPLHQAASMPEIPYFFIHGDADKAVNKARHSDRMVPALRLFGHNVEYVEVPGMGHCGPLPAEVVERERNFLLTVVAANQG